MSILIEELKREHLELFATLNKVKELGVLTSEGQEKLLSAKESLLAHLKKEDEQLYPTLKKEAEQNKDIKSTLDLFAMDMEIVSKTALEFFDKYADGVIDAKFEGEFEDLFVALGKRIKNEEEILYENYENIN